MDYYRASDWNVTCDSCGKKMKASHTKHRWDGFLVCDSCWEPRHSHDFIKVKYDKQEVPFSRRPQETFIDVPYIVPLSCTPLSKFPQADFGTADCALVNTIGISCDLYWDNVVLAMHMDGTNGSTTFTDDRGHTVTPQGNSQISTTQSKFGGASAYFDGTGDYLSVPYSTDFELANNDFSIEAWIFIAADSAGDGNATICSFGLQNIGNTDYWWFTVMGSGGTTGIGLSFEHLLGGISKVVNALATISKNAWHHVAVNRSSGVVDLFLNGEKLTKTLDQITPSSITVVVGNPLTVGGTPSSAAPWVLNGYIDELRITNGIARYTSNFTPPTVPFSAAGCTGRAVITSWESSAYSISAPYKIASNGMNYAVVNQDGYRGISYGDNNSWLTAATISDRYMRGVAASGTRYCTIGVVSSGFGAFSYDSIDNGATWSDSPSSLPSSSFWIDLAASPTSFIAIVGLSPNSIVARRTTTGSWAQSTPLSSAIWQRVNWGNDTYLIVASDGRIAVSVDDGVSWTDAVETGDSVPLIDVCWNGSYWCAVAVNGAIYRSATGLTGSWSLVRAASGQTIYTIGQLDGVFYVPVYNSATCIYSVDDGVSWSSFSLPESSTWFDIASNTTSAIVLGATTGYRAEKI